MDKKVLLRLTPTTETALRREILTKKLSIMNVLRESIQKFSYLVLSQEFSEAYARGLSSLDAMRWARRADLSGFVSKEKVAMKHRVRVGTAISDETQEQLKMLVAWSGKSRQTIIDTCLARFLDTASVRRPRGQDLSQFFYPLLSGSSRLTHMRLRWLVEHEFI